MKEIFEGVFLKNPRMLATRNLVKGFRVHGERLFFEKGAEFREWEPSQSKLGAAVINGLRELPIKRGSSVLYLGAANGATASFVSDIVGKEGVVYAVEIAQRSMRDLIFVCEKRENMLPILADARKPGDYEQDVGGKVDVIFEDVADPEQSRILNENGKTFLKKGGMALIAVKARCIDAMEEPKVVFEQAKKELEKEFRVVQEISLEPLEKDHAFFVLEKK